MHIFEWEPPAGPFQDGVWTDVECFVGDAWLESWKKSFWAGIIPNHLYRSVTTENISELLGRGAVLAVLEATFEEGDPVFAGFVCFERSEVPVVHYVYVKDDVRESGLGRRLLAYAGVTSRDTPFVFTYLTRDFRRLRGAGSHYPPVARRQKLGRVYAHSRQVPAKSA